MTKYYLNMPKPDKCFLITRWFHHPKVPGSPNEDKDMNLYEMDLALHAPHVHGLRTSSTRHTFSVLISLVLSRSEALKTFRFGKVDVSAINATEFCYGALLLLCYVSAPTLIPPWRRTLPGGRFAWENTTSTSRRNTKLTTRSKPSLLSPRLRVRLHFSPIHLQGAGVCFAHSEHCIKIDKSILAKDCRRRTMDSQ